MTKVFSNLNLEIKCIRKKTDKDRQRERLTDRQAKKRQRQTKMETDRQTRQSQRLTDSQRLKDRQSKALTDRQIRKYVSTSGITRT